MVVGGVPESDSAHLRNAANFCLDLLEAMRNFNIANQLNLALRIGTCNMVTMLTYKRFKFWSLYGWGSRKKQVLV